jgi:hypothetical protein
MNNEMKNTLFNLFKYAIALVLFARVVGWIIPFSEATTSVVDGALFTLIGIAYLVMASVWDRGGAKVLIGACGLFLIVMNFFPRHTALDIAGIFCILIPMILARTQKNSRHRPEPASH